MNIFLYIIFGLIGLLLGYKIPEMSTRIMEYKKIKTNINNGVRYLSSNWIKICMSIVNSAIWITACIYIESPLTALLISLQITLGIIIAYIDINIRIIPNELVLTMLVLGIIFQTTNYGLQGILGSIMSMIFIMIVFTALATFMGLGKVGAGDVKLAGAIGFALGYPLIITAMGTMAVVLLIFILIGLAFKKIKLSTMLPLAPFLISGYIFSLFTIISNAFVN